MGESNSKKAQSQSARADDEGELMDDVDPAELVDPLKVNPLSRLVMWWMSGLVMGGFSRKGDIPKKDLPALPDGYSMKVVAPLAKAAWAAEVQLAKAQDRGPSFLRVLWRMWGPLVQRGLFWSVMCGLSASVAKPLLLLELIDFVEAGAEDWELILCIAGLCLSLFLEGLAMANSRHWITDHFGAAYIATTASLLQTKAIQMPSGVVGAAGAEKALLGSDCLKTHESLKHLVLLPIGISTLVTGVIVLFVVSGWVCLFGLAVAAMITFMSFRLNLRIKDLERKSLEGAEERIAITTQIIESVKAIKYSAWESSFLDLVTQARDVEVGFIKAYRRLTMATVQIGRSAPILSACTTFIGLSVVGQDLRSGTVFAALTVFQALRLALTIVPVGASMYQTFLATIDRFSEYLSREECVIHPEASDPDFPLVMTDAVFGWHSAGTLPLKVPSLRVARGRITAVVGQVGSGKSSVVSAALGDMAVQGGAVAVTRSLGYVPQKAFVTCGSVLENILMGRPQDDAALQMALEMSALEDDLEQLPAGLETAIGERGITLSGGQQQRLSIARALYGKPALMILDDPLSAVDNAVAAKIFEGLKRFVSDGTGRAVLLVINQPHFLRECDHLVIMDTSTVRAQGAFADLMANEASFKEFIEGSALASSSPALGDPEGTDAAKNAGKKNSQGGGSAEEEATPPDGAVLVNILEPPNEAKEKGAQLFRSEGRKEGGVSSSVYVTYLRSMGWVNVIGGPVLCCLAYCCMGFGDRWLAHWIDQQNLYREEQENVPDEANRTREFPDIALYAPVYAGACLMMVVFMVLSTLMNTRGSSRASTHLHEEVLMRLLHAPLSWYQETPSGRILSRLSTDLSIVDNSLSQFYEHAMNFFFTIIALSTILVIVLPPVAVVLFVAACVYQAQVKSVDSTSRDLKRLANISNGPVLTSLSEMVAGQGRTLLRSMAFAEHTEETFAGHVDRMNRYYFLSAVVIAWQSFWCYVLSVVLCVAAAVYMVWSPQKKSSSEMGLALAYCFLFPYFLLFFSLTFSFFRIQITSLERLLQYSSDDVDVEPAWLTEHDPPPSWPEKGAIQFENTTLVYRPGLPPALKAVSLDIAGGERIGVVGRTGAGKSSLLVLLFRLVDAAGGKVMVDGVDISTIGLQTLRKRLAIIPQEPLLMQGSLRTNLDPFNEFPDDAVQRVLEKVGMHGVPLNTPIGNNAESLSSGQRQLVSIARSLLRDVKIVVLDEPTSSIDPMTDAVVQRVIRSEFEGCTVITIAHRLNTIIDSDRIVVMAAGRIAEVGVPQDLLQNPRSHLAAMVKSLDRDGASD